MTSPLTPDDDQLHRPTSDDMYWTETHWFAFAVPERKLTACVYPVIRTNQDVASCSVQVWDDSAEDIYFARYGRVYWHLPMPTDLRTWDLPNGLSFRCIEPLKKWQLTYREGDDIEFDLTYEGLHDPYVPQMRGMPERPGGNGHFDQLCRVTGTLTLDGERMEVDCLEMRDKSWSVRSDAPRASTGTFDFSGGAYSYGATDPDTGFCVYAMQGEGTEGPHNVLMGFLWRDGKLGNLTGGRRTRARDERGRPASVVIEGEDEHGRTFRAEGRCVNNYIHLSTPNGFAWMSGTLWDMDGVTGWGEDQEVWDAGAMRAAVRSGLVKP